LRLLPLEMVLRPSTTAARRREPIHGPTPEAVIGAGSRVISTASGTNF